MRRHSVGDHMRATIGRIHGGLCAGALLLGLGCSGADGPAGPSGPVGAAGAAGTAALNGVFPVRMFAGQTRPVNLTGAFSHFGATTTISFGDDGLIVSGVKAVSAGILSLQVQATAAARFGAHDVTVTTPGAAAGKKDEVLTLQGVFSIAPSLAAIRPPTDASVSQGGLMALQVTNLTQRQQLFDGDAALVGGRLLSTSLVDAERLVGVGLVDALAPAGALALGVSFTQGGQTRQWLADPMDAATPQVKARAAKALTVGQNLVGETFPTGGDPTSLYKFTTAAADQVMVLTVVNAGGGLLRGVYGAVAPASGKWNDGQFLIVTTNDVLHTALAYLPTAGDQYLTVLPATFRGGPGTDYQIAPRLSTGKRFSAKEPASPDGPSAPLASVTLDAPAFAQDGVIDASSDADYVRLTTPRTGRLYVAAYPRLLGADVNGIAPQPTLVGLLAADCTTPVAGTSQVQQETAATAGSTYCAKITYPGSSFGSPITYTLLASQDLP